MSNPIRELFTDGELFAIECALKRRIDGLENRASNVYASEADRNQALDQLGEAGSALKKVCAA